jgi:hypothetical protein
MIQHHRYTTLATSGGPILTLRRCIELMMSSRMLFRGILFNDGVGWTTCLPFLFLALAIPLSMREFEHLETCQTSYRDIV